MKRLTTTAIAAGLLALPTASFAGGSCDGKSVAHHIFEKADLDADGSLSAEEYAGAGLERYGVSFERMDADGDGAASLDEYITLYEAHHPPRVDEGDTV